MSPAAVLLLLLAGTPSVGEARFVPTDAEARVPERFRLEASTFAYETEELRRAGGYTVHAVRFPSPVVTPDPENNTVHAEYFRPDGPGRRPAVVVLHILGADFALSRYFAARLADRGVAALFVKLPYYGERRPPGKRFLSEDLERSVSAMRQGVLDVRRAVAWLGGREEVDPTRLGVTGISLGGIVSAVAASVDPAIDRAALLLAGGGLADVLWEMPEAARYRALWVAAGRTRADLEALTRPFDPLTYATGLKGKRVLMLNGDVDEVIPPRAALALWEAAGRPPIEWFDCGHYSAAGYLLPGIRRAVEFLGEDAAEGGHGSSPIVK
jgi:dienelactone hydrolase